MAVILRTILDKWSAIIFDDSCEEHYVHPVHLQPTRLMVQ